MTGAFTIVIVSAAFLGASEAARALLWIGLAVWVAAVFWWVTRTKARLQRARKLQQRIEKIDRSLLGIDQPPPDEPPSAKDEQR